MINFCKQRTAYTLFVYREYSSYVAVVMLDLSMHETKAGVKSLGVFMSVCLSKVPASWYRFHNENLYTNGAVLAMRVARGTAEMKILTSTPSSRDESVFI